MEPVKAPWTQRQVDNLNKYQQDGLFHPFTCGHCRDKYGTDNDEHLLVATTEGWICPTCTYTQDWAWDMMTEWQ